MKKIFLITGITMIIITAANAQSSESTLTRIGQEAPAFSCTTVKGDQIEISQLKGKVIWINFFATWCPPCKRELPVLENNVMQRYKDNPDFVLLVIGREHSMEEMKDYAKKTGLDLPFAPDEDRKIFGKYATRSIPRNVIIDKDGKIAVQSIGYTEEEFAKLEEKLAGLLN